MPVKIDKELRTKAEKDLQKSFDEVSFDYEYPGDADFKPGSPLTKKLLRMIEERKRASSAVTDEIRPEWRKVEETLNTFVPMSAVEAAAKSRDDRVPMATVIPHTLATLDTLVAYTMKAFLHPTIHRYAGAGSSESVVRAILRQKVIARYGRFFKEALALQTWYRDSYTYGFGVIGTDWVKHKSVQNVEYDVDSLQASLLNERGIKAKPGDTIQMPEFKTEWEGTKLVNIDPWNMYLDPKMTPNRFQESEFFGYTYETDPFTFLRREVDPEEDLFNGKYVRMMAEKGEGLDPLWRHSENGRHTRFGGDGIKEKMKAPLTQSVHSTRWVQTIIPKEWGLADTEYPEKWAFEIVGCKVIVSAYSLENSHGMFPFAMIAPNTCGHDVLPTSHLQSIYGIQQALDWLIRSRIQNAMTAMHSMFLVNPAAIEWSDLERPGPMKFIRLKRGFYSNSTDMSAYLKQLQTQDVTQGHYGDLQALMSIAKEANGTVDVLRGDMSSMPERPGQAGITAAVRGAASRMHKNVETMASQGMYDLAYMHGKNLDQYMSEDVWIDILGDEEDILAEEYGADTQRLSVSPWDLDGSWEVVPHEDQTEHSENFNVVTQVVQSMMQIPEIAAEAMGDMDQDAISALFAADEKDEAA